jgi:small-conductance mechanosensitive channel
MKRRKEMFTTNTVRFMLLCFTLFSVFLTVCNISLAQTNSIDKKPTDNKLQERVLEKENDFKDSFDHTQTTQKPFNSENKIKNKEAPNTLKERFYNIGTVVSQIWQFRIITLEGNPVTVGKIVIAFLLFFIGFLLFKRLTVQMKKQLVERFKFDEGAAIACQQILYYLLLVLLVLFVLNFAGIPLTFFTVIGGAAAIGVGFGSQTIVNNFLSGLILLLERPLKIGDIVEVENILGTVEWVGARSTRIKTFDNLRLVLPNSTLLQNKLVNWSITDDIVRREILVGVRYGSPVREVESLLKQAVNEHNLVEEHPQPTVLFENFGDNALIFTVLLWVRMSRTGKSHLYIRQIESDIRFRIDELFHQNDIVIAFPQRDVHIDTLKPLEVEIKQK